jgi:hypothetical protein
MHCSKKQVHTLSDEKKDFPLLSNTVKAATVLKKSLTTFLAG